MFFFVRIPKPSPRRKKKSSKKIVRRGKYKAAFKEMPLGEFSTNTRGWNKEIPSLYDKVHDMEHKKKPRYSGKMLERENKAQEEIEKKKLRVAPLYNKGGYQYIGDNPDPEIVKGLGRKL